MSAMDRAFIRAYQDQAAELSAERTAQSVATSQASGEARQSEAGTSSGTSATPPSAAPKPKMMVGRRALQAIGAASAVPAPHAAFASPRESVEAPKAADRLQPPFTPAATAAPGDTSKPPRTSAEAPIVVSAEPRMARRAFTPAAMPISKPIHWRVDSAADAPAEVVTAESIDIGAALLEKNRKASDNFGARVLAQAAPVAGLEVDEFRWPDLCSQLLHHSEIQLAALAETIDRATAKGARAFAFASVDPGDGCTTVCLALLRRLAQSGRRICLIDANLANADLGRQLGLNADRGFAAVMQQSIPVREVLIESLADRATILPLEQALRGRATEGLLRGLRAAVGELREAFDIILVDGGAATAGRLGASGVLSAADVIDAVILIQAEGTPASQTGRISAQLASRGMQVLGVVENRCAG